MMHDYKHMDRRHTRELPAGPSPFFMLVMQGLLLGGMFAYAMFKQSGAL